MRVRDLMNRESGGMVPADALVLDAAGDYWLDLEADVYEIEQAGPEHPVGVQWVGHFMHSFAHPDCPTEADWVTQDKPKGGNWVRSTLLS